MKLLGIDKNGDAVFFNGIDYITFELITNDMINERNDPNNLKNNYDFLWKDAVMDGLTEESLVDYLEELVVDETVYGNKHFFGQDDSYIYDVTYEQMEWLHKNMRETDSELVTLNCVAWGHSKPELLVKAPDYQDDQTDQTDQLNINPEPKPAPQRPELVSTSELNTTERLRYRLGSATRSKAQLRSVK